jgi:hypothetical protein
LTLLISIPTDKIIAVVIGIFSSVLYVLRVSL